MKSVPSILFAIVFLTAGLAHAAGDLATDLITTQPPSSVTPQSVLKVMERVADWGLAHLEENKRGPLDWVAGAGDAGYMALVGISGDPKYRQTMYDIADKSQWKIGPRKFHADDQCVGQLNCELYFLYRDPKMIAPLKEHLDSILAQPSTTSTLDFSAPGHSQEQWSWCDSLFMAPPTWIRLYAATGDERYLNFAVTNWWWTTDYLYDKEEHLYFRDSSYFSKKEANGAKVFWGRGNGWVMGGLVRMLQYLPSNHPDRPRFEQLFKDMSEKLLTCQQPDGFWHASLLDPKSFPEQETSGTGFFTYALTWGVNQGLLDRAKFEPAVLKGWASLVSCVDPDGKLTHVQPIGADPKSFDVTTNLAYGTGAFLLAGSEIYRMEVMKNSKSMAVKVSNPSSFYRESETVEIGFQSKSVDHVVMNGLSSKILDSQIYSSDPDSAMSKHKLLFQVDLSPGETRTYYVFHATDLAAVPQPIQKTFARYVPERHDDFAWESDRIAHRIFGKALETWAEEPLTSSGYDVWIKRTRNLVIQDMYKTMKLFDTNGPAQDDFRAGKTRGCGGLGIWKDGKLYVSANWHNYKLITTGPIRSEFELMYDAWDGGGRQVTETKRFSIDAGSNLSRVESTLSSDDKSPVTLGVGLAERPGESVIVQDGAPEIASWQTSIEKGLFVQNKEEGWMTYWQPQDFHKGTTATAFILPKGKVEQFTTDIPNLPAAKTAAPTKTVTEGQPAIRSQLAIVPSEIGKPFVYYIGAGWDLSGDFPNAKAWNDYVRRFAERRDQPLQVSVGN
ncbi:MAG TPA: glycoside hydrolase family 88 protein [Desulfuromonadaceae bacterium]|nr:glycoside hydrolase family 88 protein [Desulfuromonadaceae bacterium]